MFLHFLRWRPPPSAGPLRDPSLSLRRLWGSWGFTREPENSKLACWRVLQTPPKFHETTPKRDKKSENGGGRRKKKKNAKFWAPPVGAPTPRVSFFWIRRPFFPPSGAGSLLEFLVVFEALGPSNVHVWALLQNYYKYCMHPETKPPQPKGRRTPTFGTHTSWPSHFLGCCVYCFVLLLVTAFAVVCLLRLVQLFLLLLGGRQLTPSPTLPTVFDLQKCQEQFYN